MLEPIKNQTFGGLKMEHLHGIFGWGSPIGIALFFFFSGVGAGVFFWGLSRLNNNGRTKDHCAKPGRG